MNQISSFDKSKWNSIAPPRGKSGINGTAISFICDITRIIDTFSEDSQETVVNAAIRDGRKHLCHMTS